MLRVALRSKLSWVIAFLTFLAFLLLSVNIVAAQNLNTGGNIILQKDDVINKDYFAGGETVTIAGTINGDAYIGAGKIIIDGTINGDLIAGGGEIIVNGDVTNNIRVAGGNLTINGKVGRNATVLGGNVNFTQSSEVTGSLVSGAGNLTVYAPIGKDVYLGAGDATFGNTVGGDINAGVGNLTLTSSASVAGNLNYMSEKQAEILPDASISGQLIHTLPPQQPEEVKKETEAVFSGISSFFKIVGFISLAIIGLLIINFFPKFSSETAKLVISNFWINLATGLIVLVVTPILFILLLVTVVGIPLALILIFAFTISIYISKIFVAIWLGNFIAEKLNQKWNLYLSLIIGLISLTLISLVPILGTLAGIIVLFTGLGALLTSKRNFYLNLKDRF